MPTYEYECTKCGKVFDLVQPITESPRRKLRKSDAKPCKCNAAVNRRIGTGGGLIFKGSGFYTTDYRSDSYKKAAKADTPGGGESKTAKDGGSTSDKIPAKPSKKETKPTSSET